MTTHVLTSLVFSALVLATPPSVQEPARIVRESGLSITIDARDGRVVDRIRPGCTVELVGVEPSEELFVSVPGFEPRRVPTLPKASSISFRVPLVSGRVAIENGDGDVLAVLRVPAICAWFNRVADGRVAPDGARPYASVSMPVAMARLVDMASTSVDAAVSDFDHPDFVDALIAAHERGVRVRVLTAVRTQYGEGAARARLDESGVPWLVPPRIESTDGVDSGMMHHKFLVIDEVLVWSGHAKPQIANDKGNQCAISLTSREVARVFVREFEEIWGGSGELPRAESARAGAAKVHYPVDRLSVGATPVEVWFQPSTRDANGDRLIERIHELIGAAESELALLVLGINERSYKVLQAANARGVKIVGGVGYGDWLLPSVHSAVGRGERAWDPPAELVRPAEYATPAEEGFTYNRLLVVDRRTVAVTSSAWNLNTVSDENLIVVESPELAEAFLGHIAATVARARGSWTPRDRSVAVHMDDAAGEPNFDGRQIAHLLGHGIVDDGQCIEARIGGWSDHWPASRAIGLGQAVHPALVLRACAPDYGIRADELLALGISLHRSESGVQLTTAEGRSVRVVGWPEARLGSLTTVDPTLDSRLVLGAYEDGSAEPRAGVTHAGELPYVLDDRGYPLLNSAGLARISPGLPRVEHCANPRTPQTTADFATVELFAGLQRALASADALGLMGVQVAELSCAWGGYPDYNRDGKADKGEHLLGESVRIRLPRMLTAAEARQLIYVWSADFSKVRMSRKAILDPERLESEFSTERGWHTSPESPSNRFQVWHDISGSAVLMVDWEPASFMTLYLR